MSGWGLLGGLVGAGAVVGVLAARKSRQLTARAAAMRAALDADADELTLYLVSKGEGIGPEVRAMAVEAAERTAAYRLATHYGLTPELVAEIQRAGRRLGA